MVVHITLFAGCGQLFHMPGDVQAVFGGAGAQGALGDLWMFDVNSRQWSQPAASGEAPAPREMHTGTMVDDTRMLIYGGRGPDGKVAYSLARATA